MRVLVTGATGFIGKTLIPHILKSGYSNVAIVVRNTTKAKKLFPALPLKFIVVDDTLQESIKHFNPEIVIHLAAYFSGRSGIAEIHTLIDANITFPTLILEALKGTSCKVFVNIGTFTEFVYGAGESKCNNLYSATKSALRPIIGYYCQEAGWKWINVIVYSPYGRVNNSSKKVIDYLLDAMDSPVPIPFSGGEQKLDFIHVDDMAEFFVKLLDKINDIRDPFTEIHLGTGECHSIREVSSTMEQIFNKRINADWGKLPYRDTDSMHTVAPIGKMIKLLNWHPRISLEEGLRRLKEEILHIN